MYINFEKTKKKIFMWWKGLSLQEQAFFIYLVPFIYGIWLVYKTL